MEALGRDLRFAVRRWRRSPGLTAVVVLAIALGSGLDTVVLSLFDAVLLHRFGFADADRVVAFQLARRTDGMVQDMLSYPEYLDLRRATRASAQTAAFLGAFGLTLTGADDAERVEAGSVSADFFLVLGVEPRLGRTFRPSEDRAGAPRVAVLGDALWRRRFHADPAVLGRTLQGNGVSYEIVGVMPPGFGFPHERQLWLPLARVSRPDEPRAMRSLLTFARLRPEVSAGAAAADAAAAWQRIARRHPAEEAGWDLAATSLWRALVYSDYRVPIATLAGALASVLLLAGGNVSFLFLAQAAERRREMAVRAAFGAGRWRLVRQLATESVALSLGGGLLGAGLAAAGLRGLSLPPSLFAAEDVAIDGRVLLLSVAIACAVTLLCGLAPALQAFRVDLYGTLKEASGGGRRGRLSAVLVVAETASCTVLLITAALLGRSFLALQRVDPGFPTGPLLTFRVSSSEPRFDPAVQARQVQALIPRLAALPGVDGVATATALPVLGGNSRPARVELAGQAPGRRDPRRVLQLCADGALFSTLGVPLVAGRGLSAEEGWSRAPVAVVDRAFAERYWPGGPGASAVGRRFRLTPPAPSGWLTVVGVAAGVRHYLREPALPVVYLPMGHKTERPFVFLLRARGDPRQVVPRLQPTVRAAAPGLAVFAVQTMPEVLRGEIARERILGQSFALLGAAALLLAASGLCGVVAYTVRQRLWEIGVRLCLGARRGDVVRLVVGRGLALSLAGLGLGLAAGLGLTRLATPLLFGVVPGDPVSFAGAAILLADVAFLACWLPARRALEVEPRQVLAGVT